MLWVLWNKVGILLVLKTCLKNMFWLKGKFWLFIFFKTRSKSQREFFTWIYLLSFVISKRERLFTLNWLLYLEMTKTTFFFTMVLINMNLQISLNEKPNLEQNFETQKIDFQTKPIDRFCYSIDPLLHSKLSN